MTSKDIIEADERRNMTNPPKGTNINNELLRISKNDCCVGAPIYRLIPDRYGQIDRNVELLEDDYERLKIPVEHKGKRGGAPLTYDFIIHKFPISVGILKCYYTI